VVRHKIVMLTLIVMAVQIHVEVVVVSGAPHNSWRFDLIFCVADRATDSVPPNAILMVLMPLLLAQPAGYLIALFGWNE